MRPREIHYRWAVTALLVGTILAPTAPEVHAQAVVWGFVHDSIAGEPLVDAAVILWDTPYRAATDADGRYALEDVPAGDYSVVFYHTRLGEMGVSAGPRPVTVGDADSVRVDLGVPSMLTLTAAQCFGLEAGGETGIVAGWVGDADSGLGLPGVQVTLSWDVPGRALPERLNLRTDGNGWYLACEAPAATPISVGARFLDRQAYLREVVVEERGTADAPFLLFELAPTRVDGTLIDGTSSAPVSDAVVWLRGTSLRSLTDSDGRFDLAEVPPGTYMLVIDHIAYGTRMDTLEVPSGQRLAVDMRVDPRAIEIDPVIVTVDAGSVSERAMGGIVIGPDEISKARQVARDVADILTSQHIPGVIVRRRSDDSICVGSGQGQVRMMFNSGCVPMVVFLNGARVSNTDMVFRLPPDALDRMIIYKPIEAGNLFGLGSGNGVLMIYTKGN